MPVAFDATISLSSLIEVGIFVAGGLGAIAAMRSDIKVIKTEGTIRDRALSEKLTGMQEEIKKIAGVIVAQAVQDRRILNLEEDIRLLRRGKGRIVDDG